MRISPSDIRSAVTNPGYRIPTKRKGGPSTDSSVRKAIRTYHESGAEAAWAGLESGLSNKYWSSEQGLTKAKNARDMLDNYLRLATPDKRVGVGFTGRSIEWSGHEIAASVDVILSESRGQVGRICLTNVIPRPLTDTERALIVAAPLQGLLREFEHRIFDNVIADLELWELRTGATAVVSRERAEAAWPALQEHLRHAVGG